jgi:hypothetical protein
MPGTIYHFQKIHERLSLRIGFRNPIWGQLSKLYIEHYFPSQPDNSDAVKGASDEQDA